MECNFCKRKYNKEYDCQLCDNKFCSNICILSHFSIFHSENSSKTNDTSVKNIFNEKLLEKKLSSLQNNNILSPYITKGIYNEGEVIFDEKYTLKNFFKLTSKGKDIILGAGTFGQIFLAQNRIDNKYYAIKHMDKKKLSQCLHNLNPIYNELDIHSRITHKNIIKVKYIIETKKSFDMVLEYANTGSLFHHIRRKKGFDEKNAFMYFIQVCNAIYFLHKNNLIHRDIKPENILLEDYKKVKLCDFGWTVELSSKQRSTYCGTTEYMAPEIISSNNYDKSIDIWSLGILLYELIHGYSPFRAVVKKGNDNEVISNIKKGIVQFHKNISNECKELILSLLEENSSKRLKIEHVFQSKFVKMFQKEKLFFPKENLNFDCSEKKNHLHANQSNNININNNKNSNNSYYNTPEKLNYNICNSVNNENKENNELSNLKMKIFKEKIFKTERGKKFDFNLNNENFENYINNNNIHSDLKENIIPFINYNNNTNEEKNKIKNNNENKLMKIIENNIKKESKIIENNLNKKENNLINIIENENYEEEEEIDEFMMTPVKDIIETTNICPIKLISNIKK